ncbi:hypothetical protein CTAYLR_009923 [Chrysophaeum taylorii]|uniref:Uncharacterized protein n=1 Tax=Chrysophaeum taylorii TaxID=2483200 RepID=A0AAD7XNX2_9STRA|nr:hypothetical protein CTAYLR_009923 [Chrysophaeum taylorii]
MVHHLSSLPEPLAVLRLLDGKSLLRLECCSLWARGLINDDNHDGPPARLWRDLCAHYGYYQPGTRTRGWQRWREVYADNCCVECAEPATITINDQTVRWRNGRFAICDDCVNGNTLFRIARRPEIANDPVKLNLVLFRIATVQRELARPTAKRRSNNAGLLRAPRRNLADRAARGTYTPRKYP